ncbi:hypothetical protein WJX73_004157 [Symbiochloris irregularis]|uniref:Uncharacterized protein n=1 Tax=Symbiochloris irregularis TaxID=706552 RepID=A0AAW1PR90_9CHLO
MVTQPAATALAGHLRSFLGQLVVVPELTKPRQVSDLATSGEGRKELGAAIHNKISEAIRLSLQAPAAQSALQALLVAPILGSLRHLKDNAAAQRQGLQGASAALSDVQHKSLRLREDIQDFQRQIQQANSLRSAPQPQASGQEPARRQRTAASTDASPPMAVPSERTSKRNAQPLDPPAKRARHTSSSTLAPSADATQLMVIPAVPGQWPQVSRQPTAWAAPSSPARPNSRPDQGQASGQGKKGQGKRQRMKIIMK